MLIDRTNEKNILYHNIPKYLKVFTVIYKNMIKLLILNGLIYFIEMNIVRT